MVSVLFPETFGNFGANVSYVGQTVKQSCTFVLCLLIVTAADEQCEAHVCPLGYERLYLTLDKVTDKPFHIQWDKVILFYDHQCLFQILIYYHIPVNTKHFVVHHRINVIQRFCVYWLHSLENEFNPAFI